MTDTLLKLEDVLMASDVEWELRYDPDDKSYHIVLRNKEA